MTLETDGCLQKATYWEFSKNDQRGDPVVLAPIEIKSRWEQGAMRLIETESTPVSVHGMVMVDRELKTGSILRLGALRDTPDLPNKLVEIVDYEEVPDDKSISFQRNVRVRRWKKLLPTIIG